ncbi:fibrinogen-related molecule [Plakobranchus ocellatus]|uniref:Fibrinogen-related molecule n=1 Tax=Plakobranchus ocellatus TaxID=259542 RepID=A0AAV3Y8I1_9GAST|nr:fibrinogen-related molecule [Plakobranchus ocellatus]
MKEINFFSSVGGLHKIYASVESPGAQCNQGWFGDGCQFQCHCAGNGECSRSGTCSDGCDPQWFGPACQYDMSEYTVGPDLSWLSDNDPATCNNNDNVQSVTVALDTPHPLTWVRVVVSATVKIMSRNMIK